MPGISKGLFVSHFGELLSDFSLFLCAKISARELAELGTEVDLVYTLKLTEDFRYVGGDPVSGKIHFRLREFPGFCVVLLFPSFQSPSFILHSV